MKRTLEVLLGEESRRIGTLHHDRSGARSYACRRGDRQLLQRALQALKRPDVALQAHGYNPPYRRQPRRSWYGAVAATAPVPAANRFRCRSRHASGR